LPPRVKRERHAAHSEETLRHIAAYVEPGVLWGAFDRESAAHRGGRDALSPEQYATDPSEVGGGERAVVLIDEIDKADVDVPNNQTRSNRATALR
jgi:hypothetical protein